MDFTDGGSAGGMSEPAKDLYRAIARQEWDLVDALENAHPDARRELLAWQLISDEHLPIARDPQKALRTMVTSELEKALHHIGFVATMPELSRDLIQSYRQVQLRAGGSSIYLADPDTVNARLQDAVGDARREILCAQPGGPRKRELLETAVSRDSKALDRGVELRTIYRDTVRDHAVTAEYARMMSARTQGTPAQYRTLVGYFERLVIIDREMAFVSNHIVEGAPEHAAWMVTDPAVVAVLASIFDVNWRRALPWCGELRGREGDGVDTVSGPDGAAGVRTDPLQRAVLRYLSVGESQETTARKMGMSTRKLGEHIAELKTLFGARTLAQLTYHFGRSPDCLVDDSGPAADAGPQSAVA